MSVNVLLLSFFLLFDPGRVNHQTTTNGVPSSPGGGEQRRDGLRLNVVLFFFTGKEETKTLVL